MNFGFKSFQLIQLDRSLFICISELIIFADALLVSKIGPFDNIAKCVKLSIYSISLYGLSSSGKQICCASTFHKQWQVSRGHS